jgi:hypothetical protein
MLIGTAQASGPGPSPGASVGIADRDGYYRLAVFASGESVVLRGVSDGGELSGTRTNIILRAGERQEVDLELEGAVVLAGTVVAMDNSPLAGVQLGLARPRSSPGAEPEFVGTFTSTRANGEFRFLGNRPEGRYELLAFTQRGLVSLLDDELIEFNTQQPVTNLALRLAPMKKGRWRSFGVAQGLPDNQVWCLLPEGDGTVWIGTASGVARFDGQGCVAWNAPAALRDANVYTLRRAPQGVLWAGTLRGLASLEDQEWALRYSAEDGLPSNSPILTIAWDAGGRMWAGSIRGLFRREAERFEEC